MFLNTNFNKISIFDSNKYCRLMLKVCYVRSSEFINFGHWKYNMLNFMSIVLCLPVNPKLRLN